MMNTLSSLYSANQSIPKIALAVPPEVHQLAGYIGSQTGQLLANFAYYGLLIACLIAVIALLFSSLLLVLHHPPVKPLQPEPRLIKFVATDRQTKHPVESCVVRANRNERRLVSTRTRSGQFSH